MSFLTSFPKTSFTLSNGKTVDSFNIFKTFLLDESLKTNSNFTKTKTYEQINRPENLNRTGYTTKDLFWLTIYLNDINSFSDFPIDQSNFENNLKKYYKGKSYYVQNAKVIDDIREGDQVILFTTNGTSADDWAFAGYVKEYDSVFRRIILKEEYENPNPTAESVSDVIWIYRRNEDGTFVPIAGEQSEYLLGRKEDEILKITKIYSNNKKYQTYSPYRFFNENSFDFSDEPSSSTIIYKLCNDINDSDISAFSFETLLSEKLEEQSSKKKIKIISNDVGQSLNSYISNVSSESFERGKKIKVI